MATTAKSRTVPAPVGGWNARDAWADMSETDAVLLDNWYPTEGAVMSRKGSALHADSFEGTIETLAVYRSGSAEVMLAAANGKIWNGSSSATSLATGFSNNQWYFAQLGDSMALANGADAVQEYDGSTVGALTLSGVTSANLIGVNTFKSRSYFWEDDSQSFWYSAVNTLGGALTEFALGNLGGLGGKLMTMTNWSRDGGDGMDDFAVFVFEKGDVVIYQGSDPGDASNWSMVGIYRIGAPIGRRCTFKYGGDLVVITKDGYVSLSEVIRRRNSSISDKIRNAAREAGLSYGSSYGWQGIAFDAGGFALFNVPKTPAVQHVINLQTGAWCRFTGWDAKCWAVFNDLLYFASGSSIYKAWTGTSDSGEAIPLDGVPAFNYFGSSRIKQVTAVQPNLLSNGTLTLALITEKDFDLSPRPSPDVSIGSSSTPWGSPWGSAWSQSATLYSPFKTTTKVGRALTCRMTANIKNHALSWYATNYFYKTGGFV